MVGRPALLSQSLPSFRYRLSLFTSNLNMYRSRTVMCTGQRFETKLTPNLMCAIYSTAVPLSHAQIVSPVLRMQVSSVLLPAV